MNTNYYIPKDPAVKDVIHSAWQVDHFTSFNTEYIIPKGVVEIIFNFTDCSSILAELDNTRYNQISMFKLNLYFVAALQAH